MDKALDRIGFMQELRLQRRDDHRLYHHSRVNQSLHLLSAISFLTAYVMLAFSPVWATLVGWLVAMWSRQIGHFFFEPRDFDAINRLSHEQKEALKVGYNLRRKLVLMGLWALLPVVLWLDPTLYGMMQPAAGIDGYTRNLALAWLVLGIGGLLFRTLHLFFLRDIQTGLVWFTKILTDPLHDIMLYHRAPLFLLRGEKLDPSLREA